MPSMFLGLTGGRARGYGLVGACVNAGGKVNEVAGHESENRVHAGIGWVYLGVVNCKVGHQEV
jgi:hypothetical protein